MMRHRAGDDALEAARRLEVAAIEPCGGPQPWPVRRHRAALREAQPELMRGVSKGIMHKNTASRKVSRLASRVKTLAKPAV